MVWTPCLTRGSSRGELTVRLGHPVVDNYLEFAAARVRPNTLLATAFDLKVFFEVVAKEPAEVASSDVLGFISAQRGCSGERKVVRLADGEAGLAASTVKRRLSSVSGLFGYLVLRGDMAANPVPRGLPRRRGSGGSSRPTPLMRTARRLPRILEPAEVDALFAALRTYRDRAMVEAMVLGGLRRCEVLGLRLEDLGAGERRVFIADGKGGHQRRVPISNRFFASVGSYLTGERPSDAKTDALFVSLKGPTRGRPLSQEGIDEMVSNAKDRARLSHATCHELRHTCLTRLREAGMSLEAVQAQAGHRSIESTRVYLHLSNDWLAGEYLRASDALDVLAAAAPVLDAIR
jgi:site-specific recombinase XerD